jgi:hypothetical protein
VRGSATKKQAVEACPAHSEGGDGVKLTVLSEPSTTGHECSEGERDSEGVDLQTCQNETYILGDMFLSSGLEEEWPRVDFQVKAVQAGLHHMLGADVSKDATRGEILKTLMMLDTGVDGWDKFLDSEKKITRKRRRSPRLSDFDRALTAPIASAMRPFVVDKGLELGQDGISIVSEQKLRSIFTKAMEGRKDLYDELLLAGFFGEELRDGTTVSVVKCRAIAAGLFAYAARDVRTFADKSTHEPTVQPIHVIRAFFSKDENSAARVDRNVILDGAKFAQTNLGVTARIVLCFYEQITTGGSWKTSVDQVLSGEVETLSSSL